jgi:hypothetical protein
MNDLIRAIEKISDTISAQPLQELWPIIIPIVISIGSLIFSFIAFTFERRLLKQNRFDEIMKQYRSIDMFEHLNVLYSHWNRTTTSLKEEKINSLSRGKIKSIQLADIERIKRERKQIEKEITVSDNEIARKMVKDNTVNVSRRYVSHFFAIFAKYGLDKRLRAKDIKSFWTADNLSIIPEIIIPLEKEYAKMKYGYDDKKISTNTTLQNLKLFFDKYK